MGRKCSLLAVDGKHLARPFTICFLHYYAIYGSSLLTVLGKCGESENASKCNMNFSSHYSHRHIIDFHHCQLSSKPESLLISIVNLLLNIKATAVTVIQRVAGDEYQTDNGGITLGVRCHSLPDELTNAFHTINDGNTINITSKVQLLKIKLSNGQKQQQISQ